MNILIEKRVQFTPDELDPLDNQGGIQWPFELMGSGDSFVIPLGFTLKQARQAFKDCQLRNPRMGMFHLRAKNEGANIRVWVFTKKQIDRIEKVNTNIS